MKIEAGRTFALYCKPNYKSGKRFKGLFMAKKTIDTDHLPPLTLTELETYLREEGYIQNLEVKEWCIRANEAVAA